MSVLEYVLAALGDDEAGPELVEQAARREPLLGQLGQLYRERYDVGEDDAARPEDLEAEILIVEARLGMEIAEEADADDNPDPPDGGPGMRRAWIRMLAGRSPSPSPEAVLVTGQPGVGKGPVVEAVCRYFQDRGHCVAVDVHDWLYLHPGCAAPAGPGVATAPGAILADARDWAEHLCNRAFVERKHLVIEGIFAADSGTELIRRLSEGGYRVVVLALRMEPELSWQLVQERCDAQEQEMGAGRWVDEAEHDDAVVQTDAFLTAVRAQGLVDALHVFDAFTYEVLESVVRAPETAAGPLIVPPEPPAQESNEHGAPQPVPASSEAETPAFQVISLPSGQKVRIRAPKPAADAPDAPATRPPQPPTNLSPPAPTAPGEIVTLPSGQKVRFRGAQMPDAVTPSRAAAGAAATPSPAPAREAPASPPSGAGAPSTEEEGEIARFREQRAKIKGQSGSAPRGPEQEDPSE